MDIALFRVILIAISIILLAFFVFYAIKQKGKQHRAVAKLGAKKSGTAIHKGVQFNYQYYPGSRNSPSHFKVFIDATSNSSFKITKESEL